MESPSLEVFAAMEMWNLGIRSSGGLDRANLMVELPESRSPWRSFPSLMTPWFYDQHFWKAEYKVESCVEWHRPFSLAHIRSRSHPLNFVYPTEVIIFKYTCSSSIHNTDPFPNHYYPKYKPLHKENLCPLGFGIEINAFSLPSVFWGNQFSQFFPVCMYYKQCYYQSTAKEVLLTAIQDFEILAFKLRPHVSKILSPEWHFLVVLQTLWK